MNFFKSEVGPDFPQDNITPKIPKLNAFISFDKDKLPTKLINNNLNNNKFITSNTVINPRENQNKLINNDANISNFNHNSNQNKNVPKQQNEDSNIDLNNLFKSINEEKSKFDKPLQLNYSTSSLSEILFNKPAPLNFTKSRHLSKSCTRLEMENIKSKLNENLDNENAIVKSHTAFPPPETNPILVSKRLEKSFDAYSNSDIEFRNAKRKIHLEDDFNEVEREAYGLTNDINRNLNGDMKFNLDEIDLFLNNENDKNLDFRNEGKKSERKNKENNAIIDEKIDKEIQFIKKISAELRRIDTLSTSDIQEKDGPGFFAEADLLRQINKIKSQVIIFL